MSRLQPARAEQSRRPTSHAVVAVVVAVVALVGLVGCRAPAGWPSAAPAESSQPVAQPAPERTRGHVASDAPGPPRDAAGGEPGIADGRVPDGTTVADTRYPALANLDPALLAALRSAAAEARDDGVVLHVNSGWRSPAYQEELLDEAVSTYGSRAAAARWVATPATSPHVSGDAVDVGGSAATAWLSEHGASHGLCRVFRNEPWHFELRPEAVDHGCPRAYADPTHDPRMRR